MAKTAYKKTEPGEEPTSIHRMKKTSLRSFQQRLRKTQALWIDLSRPARHGVKEK